jgi:excisionase family DNA binding protein
MDQSDKLAFSVAEAAVHADVCRDNIYAAIREGALCARKAGRRTLILRADLEAYLDSLPRLQLRAPPEAAGSAPISRKRSI